MPATPGNETGFAAHHRSTGHSQTPTSIRTLKPPEYFPEWKDQGGSNAPGATGAGGTNVASTIQGPASGGRGMEEAIFLGAQVAAKVMFVIDQGISKGFLSRVEYNENGPAAIHEFSLS
jgi:actin-related protein 9